MPDAPFDSPSTSIDDGEVTHIPWKDSILDTIRERPAMYLGEETITALWHFLMGWNMALDRFSGHAEKPREVPNDFADWVGYRLHLDSNCGGSWKQAILSRIREEQRAFNRFFELRDEYLCRTPKVVATIRKDRRERQQQRKITARGPFVDFVELLPESLSIVVYTNDPGFFLDAAEGATRSYKGWFHPALSDLDWRPWSLTDRFEISDHSTWDRLLTEDKRYRRNLSRRRARIQKRNAKPPMAGNPPW